MMHSLMQKGCHASILL